MARHFISLREEMYTPLNFETKITSSHADHAGSNAVGRTVNSLIRCFNSNRDTIPKWVVVITEFDIINSISYKDFGVSGAYGLVLEHMMKTITNSIKEFTGGNLPFKATKDGRPHILWIEPSLHVNYANNQLRMKFIRSLHSAVQNRENMVVLPLKQNWETVGSMPITNGNLNQHGMNKFCAAMDATIRFAETKLMRNYGVPFKQIFQKEKILQEMETRLTEFEHTNTTVMARQQQLNRERFQRQQFQRIRGFFENRLGPQPLGSPTRHQVGRRNAQVNNRNNNNHGRNGQGHAGTCRRTLFTFNKCKK